MKIAGLQKMTLLDYPGHVACTVFLNGCDWRCPFCHNYELAEGKSPAVMDDTELLAFLAKRTGLLDGVAITGGEPCLYKELPDLFRRIRALGYGIKLDTNGLHPELLRELLDENLVDYVAMDIKNSPAKYAVTAGVEAVDLEKVRESIGLLMEHYAKRNAGPAEESTGDPGSAGAAGSAGDSESAGVTGVKQGFDFEFRTTVVKEFHEAADFEEIGKFIEGAPHYFLQCFTDRDTVPFGNLHAPSKDDLTEYAAIAGKYVKHVGIRGVD